MQDSKKYILVFSEINIKDVPLVGGKNASLGEMFGQLTQKGVNVPDGFALTSDAYWYYLEANKIDSKLRDLYGKLKAKNLTSLNETSSKARKLIMEASFPKDLEQDVLVHYRKLSEKYGQKNLIVAARSSATAEDSATASFAGQHETYLNVSGEKELLLTIKKCISSLFLARAIAYREEKGFDHMKIALSVGVQKMIRSDLGSSGVIFTLDTETGFRNVVLINSIWGVGEMIVKGKITPDQFFVFKPTLKEGFKSIIVKNLGRKDKKYIFDKTGLKEVIVPKKDQLTFSLDDEEILKLAKWAYIIEEHYQWPQDIEWAKDGKTGELFVVQSRPETVHAAKRGQVYEEYMVKTDKKPIVTGIAIGNKIGQGKTRTISDVSKSKEFKKGEVLVAKMTDPDWMPIMRIASAIVTDEGGKTCHAAIVSRELGIPCIVGTKNATQVLKNGQMITVDCTQGLEGRVYEGKIVYELKSYNLEELPKTKTKLMVNVGVPDTAFKTSFLPNDGVGLAREEFIIAEKIKVHPLALYHYKEIRDTKSEIRNKFQIPKSQISKTIKQIDEITIEHKDKKEYFIKELAEGIAQIAAAFYPKKVIVRFSDFKTNEYKNLLGGELFEKEEQNPMIGFRGASRYLDKEFQPAFKMECEAIKRAREVFGLKNICVMVPFCRTVEEGKGVLDLMKEYGLEKGKDNLEVYVMCEIPSNVILAEEFLEVFDGMSIGSNDLTQLVLGLDRDSAKVAHVGDERNEAVKEMIKKVIAVCKEKGKYVGICGEAPSTFPEIAEFLVKEGIESMSLNPDSIIKTTMLVAEKEKELTRHQYTN
ncbi:MAG: phosphoenolpyruvate synthase [Candidatus Nealsonbacteria bacterium CG_4_10_14_0_2_um_filter_38_17]|uniref:Phosphoenolpyruvate synthase n=2 Tax=Candidatus Nealsoniibacteriota TaxID=1817911 RepID=A0A2M7UYH9_9BACT|nr:MAG: phosphoenolpyruvate synthase [Candidatus Nealsonbacteria bacterium CG23_combo_of_CG06-09_8_20_14_all_38_19]PIZ89033.1 MAG: phosphoenolpyruvate synthase [Candidatus Nealsonbacteria bacterium CG_4_10_14_0_2_um_filter_38_17]